jgi:hypothetical protein
MDRSDRQEQKRSVHGTLEVTIEARKLPTVELLDTSVKLVPVSFTTNNLSLHSQECSNNVTNIIPSIEAFKREYFKHQLKFWNKQNKENRKLAQAVTRINKKEVSKIAVDLHSKMYKAFADARITAIEGICLEGLAESMRQRMSRRKKTDILTWEMTDKPTAKVLSFKQVQGAMKFKGHPVFVQQVVVRIQGTQKLKKGVRLPGTWTREQQEAGEGVVWKEERLKRPVEYLIMQRSLLALKPGEWGIWGFGEETTLDNFKESVVKSQDVDSIVSKSRGDSSNGEAIPA